MKYISAEEFLKQSEEVQKVFLDWWKQNISAYDLYKTRGPRSDVICLKNDKEYIDAVKDLIKDAIPLFTEGQLRNFIEEKIDGKIDCMYLNHDSDGCRGYNITVCTPKLKIIKEFKDLGYNLLQAYWRVACKIAEEKQGL